MPSAQPSSAKEPRILDVGQSPNARVADAWAVLRPFLRLKVGVHPFSETRNVTLFHRIESVTDRTTGVDAAFRARARRADGRGAEDLIQLARELGAVTGRWGLAFDPVGRPIRPGKKPKRTMTRADEAEEPSERRAREPREIGIRMALGA